MFVIDTETYPAENLPDSWGLKMPYVRLLSVAGKNGGKVFDLSRADEEEKKRMIERILEKGVVGHNIGFDLKALWITLGKVKLPPAVFDTLAHEWFVNPKYREGRFFSLKEVVRRRLKEVISKEEQKSDWKGELNENQIEYAKKDVEVTLDVFKEQKKDFLSVKQIGKKYYVRKGEFFGEEFPLGYSLVHKIVPFISLMEYWGIPFLTGEAETVKEELSGDIDELKEKIQVLTGAKNVRGKEFLESFKRMGYREIKSLSSEEIEKVWSKLTGKQKTVYLLRKELIGKERELAFIKQALQFERNGRIYPSWTQITKTGRIVSRMPNVQNLPKKSRVKKLIKPPSGFVFVAVDFPQIEIRIASKWIELGINETAMNFPFLKVDKGLVYALQKGEDIHRLTASVIFNKDVDEVDDWERSVGKVVNFSFLYGGKEALATALIDNFPELSGQVKEELIDKIVKLFYKLYPDVEFFHKVLTATKREVYTLAGTPVFPFRTTDALNYPIQASGADILKAVAVSVVKGEKENLEKGTVKPIMVIHDELIFEVKEEYAEQFRTFLEKVVKETIEELTGTPIKEELTEIKKGLA